jgi:hypothetical protein
LWVKGDGDAFDDLDAEALKGWDVLGHIGQETNLANAEIGEDLSTEAYVAEDALIRSTEALGVGAICVMNAELRWV